MKKNLILFIFLIVGLYSCSELQDYERRFFWFNAITSDISYDTLVVSVQLRDRGDRTIEQHGFVYSLTNTNPTVANEIFNLGGLGGTRNFSTTFKDLIPNTTYYIRPYIISDGEISYGSTLQTTTQSVVAITGISAKGISNLSIISQVDSRYNLSIFKYYCPWTLLEFNR